MWPTVRTRLIATSSEKKKKQRKINGTDVVLIIVAIYIVIFNYHMIHLFYQFQIVPDSLIVALYGVTFGELGFCTYIYKNRKKREADMTQCITSGDLTGFDDAEVLDVVHGSDIPSEAEANGTEGHERDKDSGKSDSGSSVHRVKQRKLWFN